MSEDANVTALLLSGFNQTLLQRPYLCTVDTCPLTLASIHYVPSLAGNAIFLVIFALCLVAQLYFTYRYRTWSFSLAMFGGLVLEILGYVSRIQMHGNPFNSNYFLMYLVVITIAPCFFAAAIYLSLSRLIIIYGEPFARFKPRTYTIIFICCDIFSLVLQALGGGIADTADNQDTTQTGIDIMIAGLVFQVVSLTAFSALCLDYFLSVRRNGGISHRELQSRLRQSTPRRLKVFIAGLITATFTIYIRSIFRVAELSEGFDGHLANDEVTYMILEGAMIAIAAIALTVAHPGFVFHRNWTIKKIRNDVSIGRTGGELGAGSRYEVPMKSVR
ncbi:MAG: hypothetical protein Q9183_004956 [Haloplaca sp. 2 TL-2023]